MIAPMPRIRIICDGGGPYGFGNIRRSATLAAAFKANGFGVRLEALSSRAEALLPVRFEDQGAENLRLVDLPYSTDEVVLDARATGVPVAALDHDGTQLPDLAIDVYPRPGGPRVGGRLVGLDFAIIRPEIAALAPAPAGKGVLVVIGGGECDRLGERAAARLDALGCEVTLIDGPLAASPNPLPASVTRLRSPADIAARMAACAWAVAGGGGAMMELICLGKPVHVLPRTPDERAFTAWVQAQGGLLGIGLDTLTVPDPLTFARVADQARTLIDGRGIERIVSAVAGLVRA